MFYCSWLGNTREALVGRGKGKGDWNQMMGCGGRMVGRGEEGRGSEDWNGTAVARIQYHGDDGRNDTSSNVSLPSTKPVQRNDVVVSAGIIVALLVLALAFVLWFNCKRKTRNQKRRKSQSKSKSKNENENDGKNRAE